MRLIRSVPWRLPLTSFLPRVFCFLIVFAASHESFAQALPATAGVTLSDKPIVLADAVRSHAVVLIAGFSREGGNGAGEWAKALRADPAFTRIVVYQIAILAGAPKLMRGMIKSGMKRGVAPADQDRFVVLSDDEQPWKSFFAVSNDSEAYVVLLDPQGKVLWRGHGSSPQLEPQLKAALP
jgi:hypothetical protein